MKPFLSVVLVLLMVGMVEAQTSQPAPATKVRVTPPKDFVPAARFQGFVSPATGASIIISDLPAPVGDVTGAYTPEALQTKGMRLLSKESSAFGELRGSLLCVLQTSQGTEYLRWIGVFGDERRTCIVAASLPKEQEASLSAAMKAAVLSARLVPVSGDPLAELGFEVAPAGDLKVAKVIGSNVLMSRGGVYPAKGPEVPILVAGPSIGKPKLTGGRQAYAESRLRQASSVGNVLIRKTSPLTVNGLSGYESVGEATDKASGAKVMVYQAMLFEEGGYYLLMGIVADKEAEGVLPAFKATARTLKLKAPAAK